MILDRLHERVQPADAPGPEQLLVHQHHEDGHLVLRHSLLQLPLAIQHLLDHLVVLLHALHDGTELRPHLRWDRGAVDDTPDALALVNARQNLGSGLVQLHFGGTTHRPV